MTAVQPAGRRQKSMEDGVQDSFFSIQDDGQGTKRRGEVVTYRNGRLAEKSAGPEPLMQGKAEAMGICTPSALWRMTLVSPSATHDTVLRSVSLARRAFFCPALSTSTANLLPPCEIRAQDKRRKGVRSMQVSAEERLARARMRSTDTAKCVLEVRGNRGTKRDSTRTANAATLLAVPIRTTTPTSKTYTRPRVGPRARQRRLGIGIGGRGAGGASSGEARDGRDRSICPYSEALAVQIVAEGHRCSRVCTEQPSAEEAADVSGACSARGDQTKTLHAEEMDGNDASLVGAAGEGGRGRRGCAVDLSGVDYSDARYADEALRCEKNLDPARETQSTACMPPLPFLAPYAIPAPTVPFPTPFAKVRMRLLPSDIGLPTRRARAHEGKVKLAPRSFGSKRRDPAVCLRQVRLRYQNPAAKCTSRQPTRRPWHIFPASVYACWYLPRPPCVHGPSVGTVLRPHGHAFRPARIPFSTPTCYLGANAPTSTAARPPRPKLPQMQADTRWPPHLLSYADDDGGEMSWRLTDTCPEMDRTSGSGGSARRGDRQR
ncbi:hypothetical protein C8R47DRAFT_1082427 [Mycena vitilis]|nr:hypothetical protein C8R47DRAFT_1082427 [Mycena vitilis]